MFFILELRSLQSKDFLLLPHPAAQAAEHPLTPQNKHL